MAKYSLAVGPLDGTIPWVSGRLTDYFFNALVHCVRISVVTKASGGACVTALAARLDFRGDHRFRHPWCETSFRIFLHRRHASDQAFKLAFAYLARPVRTSRRDGRAGRQTCSLSARASSDPDGRTDDRRHFRGLTPSGLPRCLARLLRASSARLWSARRVVPPLSRHLYHRLPSPTIGLGIKRADSHLFLRRGDDESRACLSQNSDLEGGI